MKAIKPFLLLMALLFGIPGLFCQTNELKAIANAINASDTKTIYDYCENSISVNMPGTNGQYSKTQTRKILEQFFKEHPLKETKLIKSQSKNQTEYYSIVEYKSENQSFNFFVEIKKKGEQFLIQKIQIQEIRL